MPDELLPRTYSFIVRLRCRTAADRSEAGWQGTLELVPDDGRAEALLRRFNRVERIPALIVEMLMVANGGEASDESHAT